MYVNAAMHSRSFHNQGLCFIFPLDKLVKNNEIFFSPRQYQTTCRFHPHERQSLTIKIPTLRTSDTVQSMLKSSLPARKFDGRYRRSGSVNSPVPILVPSSTSVCGQFFIVYRFSCKYIIEVKTSIWK